MCLTSAARLDAFFGCYKAQERGARNPFFLLSHTFHQIYPSNFLQPVKSIYFERTASPFLQHQEGNNDINDPTNEWRSHRCISVLLLKRKLEVLKEAQDLRLPTGHAVKHLVKLFIDLGRKVFPVSCSFPCRRAFQRKISRCRQSLVIDITYSSTLAAVNARHQPARARTYTLSGP